MTLKEDPRAAVVRYQDALKDGYVLATFVKVLIIGAAGVGKTHLLRLFFNEPPPEIRQSTPVMERPVQAILTVIKEHSTFEKVTDKELYELLSHTINTKKNEPLHKYSPRLPNRATEEVSHSVTFHTNGVVLQPLSQDIKTNHVSKLYDITQVSEVTE